MHRKLSAVIIAVTLTAVFYIFYVSQEKREFVEAQKQKGMVYVEVIPFKTNIGWGYDIHVDGKKYIHQEFIPAIYGRRGFATKEEALLVGNKALAKVTASKTAPTISIKDLVELGIPLQPADTTSAKRVRP